MKLHWSPRSPFVRKVMIVAHEVGIADRIRCVRTVATMSKANPELMVDNPLSKLPTLVLDDGTALYDSTVICEYLDHLHEGPKLFPAGFDDRLTALRRQALGDGLLDNLLLWRSEMLRPVERRSPEFLQSFAERTDASLRVFECEADALAASPFSIGHIAMGCALSYLDFRFPELDWRSRHPRSAAWHAGFLRRPSVQATDPIDDS